MLHTFDLIAKTPNKTGHNMRRLAYCLMLIAFFSFAQCKKSSTEEPQLPPETTTGAMTFGCKVNGKVFVPKDGSGQPGLFCQYVNLGSGQDGGWYLNIPATNWQTSTALRITADSLLVHEGLSYEIRYDSVNNTRPKGYFYSAYTEPSRAFIKTNNDTGSVRIVKFDTVNRILSGTFSYSATRLRNGEKILISEGRFDIRY